MCVVQRCVRFPAVQPPAPPPMQAFASYIKRVGTAMVSDPEQDRVLVQELLQFKEKLDKVLNVAFHSSEPFSHSLKEAFECFINVRQVRLSLPYIRSDSGKEHARLSHLQNRPAELVAHFIDGKLRSGNKGTSEEELEEVLDKTMTLFRYIDGKVRCLFQLDNGCAHNSVARCL